jgi:hypothetical protein
VAGRGWGRKNDNEGRQGDHEGEGEGRNNDHEGPGGGRGEGEERNKPRGRGYEGGRGATVVAAAVAPSRWQQVAAPMAAERFRGQLIYSDA